MAKVLVSFLGAALDGYKSANYRFSDGKVITSTFIAEALSEYHQIDKMVLIGTAHSMWDEIYDVLGRDDIENKEYIRNHLKEVCKASNHVKSELTQQDIKSIEEGLGDNAKVIIDYLIKRAEEDPGMGEDILQPHKTYRNCWSYIMDQARKKLSNRSGAVRSDVVFEWAEDYYRLDDKAIAEKEKKAADKVKKGVEKQRVAAKQAEKKAEIPKAETKKEKAPKKTEKAAVRNADSKPKKKEKNDELDGQMDIFAFLGGA